LRSLGVARGDRVAVRSWNRPEVAWLVFGAARVGASVVLLNARLTEAEVAPLLERAQAKVRFGDLPGATGLEVMSLGNSGLSEPVEDRVEIDDESVAVGLFTSGTTGVAKLVELTHANLFASAAANAQRLGGEAEQRWLGTLPLFHVGGLAMLYRCTVYGASIALETSFDAARTAEALDRGVTHLSLVPTMLDRLLEVRGERPFVGVRAALIGGGPMTTTQLQRARAAGLPVLQTYGLTEACSQVTTEIPSEADGTTAGSPMHGVTVRIVNADASGIGEIEVSGPTVAKGLGPWLQTKDLGRLDERGRLTIFARRLDLILSGGENVYPAEVEGVLREHPQVRDVAVTGRDDATWGQVPVAVIVGDVEGEVLNAWARERLAAFKVPKAWIRVEALPRNATGKLDRAKVRALTSGDMSL
jgi:O-succinylbenzoic acid--CoA ligase